MGCVIHNDVHQFCPARVYETSDKPNLITEEGVQEFVTNMFKVLLHEKYIDTEAAKIVKIIKVDTKNL
ncbi:MAG TPA: hypothetical protein ENI29_21915 [bacterium]|nr:hypothetical protein [bacterium]